MGNPFMDRIAAKGQVAHGKKSEKKVALSLGARLHPNSGAKAGAKSDASKGPIRLEMKSTTSKTLPLELGWLNKINSEALRQGQRPAVAISFVDNEGRPVQSNATWVAIPEWLFKELTEE